LPLLEKEAKERQRRSNEYRGNGRSAKKCANRNGKGKSAEAAARIVGTNPRYVEMVKSISTTAPELIDKIRLSDLTITEARKLARLPKAARTRAMKMEEEGQASSISHALAKVRSEDKEKRRNGKMLHSPVIHRQDAVSFLKSLKPGSANLLLTDPPFMTDVEDVAEFAATWVPLALSRLKPTGRAYFFTGAYPEELQAYLSVLLEVPSFTVGNVMVWSYRNTLGLRSKTDYHTNWQAVFHVRGAKAPELDCPEMAEHFAVQEINAPDGRQGNRLHVWQKPNEIAERFIRHSTKKKALVVDCFAGTGTFLLSAARLGRKAVGCDIDQNSVRLCVKRGCVRGK